jgi:hypothetical protein
MKFPVIEIHDGRGELAVSPNADDLLTCDEDWVKQGGLFEDMVVIDAEGRRFRCAGVKGYIRVRNTWLDRLRRPLVRVDLDLADEGVMTLEEIKRFVLGITTSAEEKQLAEEPDKIVEEAEILGAPTLRALMVVIYGEPLP